MTRLADQLARLTPQQRALLEQRLRERDGGAAQAARIRRRPPGSSPILSQAQQRLWFIERLQGGGAYHIPVVVRIDGALSIPALQSALDAIVHRHEVLRTSCVEEEGRAVARVAEAVSCPLHVVDVAGASRDERVEEARRLATIEAERSFDLSVPPLMRASLLRVSDFDHVLVLVVHHIVSDAWSIGVLGRELGAFYAAFSEGRVADLAPLPIQYADFALWQQEMAERPQIAEQVDWWRQALKGATVLDLPFDRPRPAAATLRGGREHLDLPAELLSRLKQISQARDATLFMTLLAAFELLLARWSGQADLAIGTPIAGRNWTEVEPLIGLFINTLVLRTDVSGDPPFVVLLDRVRATVTGALAHQDVPFDLLVDKLQIPRTLSHAPLTPVVFGYQNVPPATLTLAGLSVSPFEYARATSRFEMSLLAVESASGLHCSIEYSADVFDATTVRRVLESYAWVLDQIAREPARSIGSFSLLPEAERRRVLLEWNATQHAYPHVKSIPESIAEQARLRPGALAVVTAAASVTYAELDRQASRVADRLLAAGVCADTPVGVLCDRGIAFVVAALGVLKAGGTYAPIDPRTPDARLCRILDRAAIRVLLVDPQLRSIPDVPATLIDLTTVDVGGSAPTPNVGSDERSRVAIDLDHLAYIVHTSGSTGEPNGVGITHRSLLNLVHWHQREYAITHRDVAAQVASVGFDACVWELWPYLTAGAAVHIPPADVRDVPQRMWPWIQGAGITVMFLPTPLAEAALQEPIASPVSLRALLTGGDRLHQPAPRSLPFAFINHYGPTESAVVASCGPVDLDATHAPTIGRPIDNTQVYVLDPGGEPVPVGVFGELHIGGIGLARGYVGSPRLTAERFVPDGISGRPGTRLYRTGDLVRFRDDGALEFLGRRDNQVKIRGYRIELGEIEAALTRMVSVTGAAVAVVPDPSGTLTIVAYVVTSEPHLDDAELRAFVKQSLPDYMVPSVFVRLEALPLTTNGKVDRAALPPPSFAAAVAREIVAPRNEAEEVVVQMCRDLLGVADISVLDNFFELGGHSLLVTQFAFRLQEVFETPVSVRLVFESATLADLADAVVERMLAENDCSGA